MSTGYSEIIRRLWRRLQKHERPWALLGRKNISPLKHIPSHLPAQLHGCPKPKQHYTCLHWPCHIIHSKLNPNHSLSISPSVVRQERVCAMLDISSFTGANSGADGDETKDAEGKRQRRGLGWRTSQGWKTDVHKGALSELHKCKQIDSTLLQKSATQAVILFTLLI